MKKESKVFIKGPLKKGNAERYIIIVALTLLPLIACYLINGAKLSSAYLPNSPWNDEILYYKMIGAFVDHNGPLGYFGYNESHAAVGNLGPWSPFLLPVFILYAKIFGWSLMSPIYCNILMLSAAMLAFAWIVHPNWRQTCFIGIIYCLNYYYTRYTLSAMMETYIDALLLLFFSLSVGIFRGRGEKRAQIIGSIITLNIVATTMTLARPYYVLLFCVPGYYWYKKSGKRGSIILQTFISAACMLLYFVCVKYLCAAYFTDIVNTEWLKLIFTDTHAGIYNFLNLLLSQAWSLLRYVGGGIILGDAVGGVWTIFFTICLWFCYKWKKEEKGNRILWIYSFTYLFLMLLAVYFMYSIGVGSRHIAAFVFVAIFMVAVFEKTTRIKLYIGIVFVWCLCERANEDYSYRIPAYTDEKAEIIRQGADTLAEFDMIDEDSDNPWDNTIIWLLGETDFTHLYAIPDGMGINVCNSGYIQSNFDHLQPKYMMTNNKGDGIDAMCETSGKELLAEYGTVHIWKLRE